MTDETNKPKLATLTDNDADDLLFVLRLLQSGMAKGEVSALAIVAIADNGDPLVSARVADLPGVGHALLAAVDILVGTLQSGLSAVQPAAGEAVVH